MASETKERNALAELAHTLCGVVIDDECYPTVGKCVDVMNAIKKARRIINELAKASDAIGYADEFAKDGFKDCIYIPATQQLCVKKILKCRAIAAEEGENND